MSEVQSYRSGAELMHGYFSTAGFYSEEFTFGAKRSFQPSVSEFVVSLRFVFDEI